MDDFMRSEYRQPVSCFGYGQAILSQLHDWPARQKNLLWHTKMHCLCCGCKRSKERRIVIPQ